jgi:hypothetical protein
MLIFSADPSAIKPVFTSYRSDACRDELETALNAIKKSDNRSWARMCLAQLALEDRKAETLKWLLDEGSFGFPHEFGHEADCVNPATDPEMFRVLEESEFRERWPRQPPTPPEMRDPDAVYDESQVMPDDGTEFDLDDFIENLERSHPLY